MSADNSSQPLPPVMKEPSGGMEPWIIGGVIGVVVLVLLVVLVIALRYLYRHKGSYLTNEAKGTEFAESADAALKHDPALQDDAHPDSQKEYFI